jgi:hypothetical protein
MYTLHDKHVEKHTHGILVFYGHVLSLKRIQAARLLSFYCETVFEINKLRQIDRLDVVLVKMRWTGVFECWRLDVHKGTLPMSLEYPRVSSPGWGTDFKWLEMSCRATPEVGNVHRLEPRTDLLSFRPGANGSRTLRPYVTTSIMQLVCV